VGENGRIDPFTEIYEVSLVFEIRCFVDSLQLCFCDDCPCDHMPRPDEERRGCQEDRRTVLYPPDECHCHLLALSLVPQPRKAGKEAVTELFTTPHTYVETRRHAELTSDAIDVLIVDGETTPTIVGVSYTLVVA